MGAAGGLSGIHRLMNHNKALELELQRVKGMIPNSVTFSSRCGVDGDQQLEALMGCKGDTQAGRSYASEAYASGPDCGMNRIPQLDEKGRLKEGTQPVRQNVSMGNFLETDAVAIAINPVDDARATALEYQPPVVGKSPTYYQFFKAMQRWWNPPGGLEIYSRENGIFYCKFRNENDMKKVIKDGPWYMDGKLVVVKKFSSETNCEDEILSSIPIWVKLPCLLVQWWSIEGVRKVVSRLGHPLYFDLTSASKSRIAYARYCIEVAMEKNLPSSVLCMGGDNMKKRQNITYDWVPKRCSSCKEFGHMVAECGGAQQTLQQKGKGGWNNNKKMGKGQQIYRPKEKSTIIDVKDQMKSNTQKEGGIARKDRQIKMMDCSKDTIYQTKLLNSRKATIKATPANSFHLLVDMDDDGTGDKRDGGKKGNHKYFCSDDEEEKVDDLSPRQEAQKRNLIEGVEINNEEEKGKERDLALEPGTTIKGVEVDCVESMSADEDSREREAGGSGEEITLELPLILENKEVVRSSHGNQVSDDEIQESYSEKEEEETIQSYGKQPAESGIPPTLTVSNQKYKGEIEVPLESKKVKKRSTPAPERPASSRTTRHSFMVG